MTRHAGVRRHPLSSVRAPQTKRLETGGGKGTHVHTPPTFDDERRWLYGTGSPAISGTRPQIGGFASLPLDRFAFFSTETGYPLIHTSRPVKQGPCQCGNSTFRSGTYGTVREISCRAGQYYCRQPGTATSCLCAAACVNLCFSVRNELSESGKLTVANRERSATARVMLHK